MGNHLKRSVYVYWIAFVRINNLMYRIEALCEFLNDNQHANLELNTTRVYESEF
jgi:hypothetical protein